MKKLPLLLALIVLPAWAGDVAPVAEKGVSIELKGASKNLSALMADLEKDAAYKEAACSGKPAKSGKAAKITCGKADGALLVFLSKNAPANVRWTISAAATAPATRAPAPAASAPLSCPTGCAVMNCPPPSGPIVCCNTTTHQAC